MSTSRDDKSDKKKPPKVQNKNAIKEKKEENFPFSSLPPDLANHGIFSAFLTKKEQILLAKRTAKEKPADRLASQVKTNTVLSYILQRTAAESKEYEYAFEPLLNENPELLLTQGQGIDRFGRTSDILTPLQAAYKVGDWFIWEKLEKLFEHLPQKTKEEAKAIALRQIKELEARAYLYDLTLMPTINLTSIATIEPDKLPGYGRVFFMQTDEKTYLTEMISKGSIITTQENQATTEIEIPKDAIVALKSGNQITTYKWVDNAVVEDQAFELPQKDNKEKEEKIEEDRAKIKMQKFAKHFHEFFPKVGAAPRIIEKDFFPALFEKTMTLCHYPLPALPPKPILIKQIDEDGKVKISVWGNTNGKWRLTPLDAKDMPLFEQLEFPASDKKDPKIIYPPKTGKENPTIQEIYEALKKYHTTSKYDNTDFDKTMEFYITNFDAWCAREDRRQIEDYWCQEVGDVQTRLPALAMNYFCSEVRWYNSKPKFEEEKLSLNFKLSGTMDFFDSDLSENFAVIKGGGEFAVACHIGENTEWLDQRAIATLCEVADVKRAELKQRLSPAPAPRLG